MSAHRATGYQPGINWPLFITLIVNIGLWAVGIAVVWWLI